MVAAFAVIRAGWTTGRGTGAVLEPLLAVLNPGLVAPQ